MAYLCVMKVSVSAKQHARESQFSANEKLGLEGIRLTGRR